MEEDKKKFNISEETSEIFYPLEQVWLTARKDFYLCDGWWKNHFNNGYYLKKGQEFRLV